MAATADSRVVGSVASGFVVSDLMALLLVMLAVAAVVADRVLPGTLGALVLMLVLVARVWTRLALEGVDYAVSVSPHRAFEGDTVVLTLTIANRKPLPVVWLRVREHIPPGLLLADEEATGRGTFGASLLLATTGLGALERLRLRYRLTAQARGHYVLGPGRLESGDPFGFYDSVRVVARAAASLVVYPRIPALPRLAMDMARPVGEVAARVRTIDDPTRPVTVREHRQGDDLRHVDWKATARRGAPWVRVNEASVGGAVLLLLECDTRVHGVWDDAPHRLEACVRTAAALARHLLARGHAVGLVANGVPPGDRARVAVAPRAGQAQLALLLDALARVQPIVVRTLSELVEGHAARVLPFGVSVVCIAAVLRPDAAQLLAARSRRGAKSLLVYLGDDAPAPLPGVPVTQVAAGDVLDAPDTARVPS